MAAKILNLVALSALAILSCSFAVSPVNALSLDTSPNYARQLGHHQVIAKKKRADTRRCKPRPSSSVAPSAAKKSASSPPAAPSPTTTKPASTPPATPPPSSGGRGKVGLAWANGDDGALKNFVTNKVSCLYTWSPWKPAGIDALGLEFAPMLWGVKQIADFQRLVKPGYAKTALGFNEPNHDGQASIDPGYGATLWRQYMEPLKASGYRLVSPAVTSAPSGKTWLQNFFRSCGGCHVDAVAVHWYGTDPQAFIAYVQDFHNTFNKPIWVTEFACQSFTSAPQCSAAQVANFMNTVTAFMDGAWYVEKYFAFGVTHNMVGVNPLNQLMAGNGQPTALGSNYLS
jgi:hypothetical protein